ncbi:MAG: tRNA uridine-5-carboxymethylaminomethyl(34) synthesis GTPase MnmE [Clostridia bacterium]|nr:tRNA uridine-5-carboxymethylaminomethyl(34) synthesis GTPase MnmE [Clostridia bacterium]
MLDDTIAAISTAPGVGGIGIIRISGENAFNIVDKIFEVKDKDFCVKNPVSGTIKYGHIKENEKVIDEVLVSFFVKPHSYTTEDVAEINCHGGVVVIRKILSLLLENGARLAEPGEFTKRAFINGRIDLTEAEAVIDIISSKSDKARSIAVTQLNGGLSNKLKEINNVLYDILIKIEAGIDYPEHEIEEVAKSEIKEKINETLTGLDRIYSSFDEGKVLKDGVKTVILGKPNVGKSSLMNVLLKENRAIVTDIPGTTRDLVTETTTVRGIPLLVVDTAGIRETEDKIEEIGVQKAVNEIDTADMIIAVFDLSRALDDEDKNILKLIENKKSIIIVNKDDLERKWNAEEELKGKNVVFVSLKNMTGIEEVEDMIENMWKTNDLSTSEDVILTTLRHKNLVFDAINELKAGIEAIDTGMPLDMISINVKDASLKIGEILGVNVTEDVIKGIFERFCLGK